MSLIDIVGWIASACFALCGAPQAWDCYKAGHGKGINKLFMWVWLSGELLMMPYVVLKHEWDWPIMTNLILNSFFILVILKYIYKPREL